MYKAQLIIKPQKTNLQKINFKNMPCRRAPADPMWLHYWPCLKITCHMREGYLNMMYIIITV